MIDIAVVHSRRTTYESEWKMIGSRPPNTAIAITFALWGVAELEFIEGLLSSIIVHLPFE